MLDFEHPVQRKGSVWQNLNKSLLVHSLLANYPVPPIYLIKTKTDDGEIHYSVLDGKQRVTSLIDYVKGGFALHGSTPDAWIDGDAYELSNHSFDELQEDLRDAILGYRFTVYCIENATEDEVFECFARLNNGVALSPIAKCRAEMTYEMADWTKKVCSTGFYQSGVSMTVAQLRADGDLCTLLQTMMLLDARQEGYDYTSISTKDIRKYCRDIKGCYGNEKAGMIEEVFGYLSEAFDTRCKFLKKSNIPMVGVLAKVAMEYEVSPQDYKEFVEAFADEDCEAWKENCGQGNIKRTKTEGRLLAIASEFQKYFGIDERSVDILSVEDRVAHTESQ